MNGKKIRQLINVSYAVAAILILASAIFKIQHYPYSNHLHYSGFALGILVSATDNFFLRKYIKELENKKLKD